MGFIEKLAKSQRMKRATIGTSQSPFKKKKRSKITFFESILKALSGK